MAEEVFEHRATRYEHSRNCGTKTLGSRPHHAKCPGAEWTEKSSVFARFAWCCRCGLNTRPLPYQGSALPLSYGSKPLTFLSFFSMTVRSMSMHGRERIVARPNVQ